MTESLGHTIKMRKQNGGDATGKYLIFPRKRVLVLAPDILSSVVKDKNSLKDMLIFYTKKSVTPS